MQEGLLLKILEAVVKIHQDNKLLVISDSGEVREKWFSNADPIFQFLEDCTFKLPENTQYIYREELLEAFLQWCNDKKIPETKRLKTVDSFTSGAAWYNINTKRWDGFARHKTGRYQGKVFVFPYAFKMDDVSQKYKVEPMN